MVTQKIKNIINMDMRISLYQTSMNNAGRNFEGRAVPVKKVADFASNFYKMSIREIENLGELSLAQLQRTILPTVTVKATKIKDFKGIMSKAKKINGKGKK